MTHFKAEGTEVQGGQAPQASQLEVLGCKPGLLTALSASLLSFLRWIHTLPSTCLQISLSHTGVVPCQPSPRGLDSLMSVLSPQFL